MGIFPIHIRYAAEGQPALGGISGALGRVKGELQSQSTSLHCRCASVTLAVYVSKLSHV